MKGTHIILPVFRPVTHDDDGMAPLRARYVVALIKLLEARNDKTDESDQRLMDKIESVLSVKSSILPPEQGKGS